jgi:hypothetical protein
MTDSKLEQTHCCPWHERDLKALRVETSEQLGTNAVCEPCPECGPHEQLHDVGDDFCWCEK